MTNCEHFDISHVFYASAAARDSRHMAVWHTSGNAPDHPVIGFGETDFSEILDKGPQVSAGACRRGTDVSTEGGT